MTPVQAMTADAIYREYDQDLDAAKEHGCDIVNCDSSHLFAVSREVGIRTTECGVISDLAAGQGENWQSTLAVMLSTDDQAGVDPMTLAGEIVEFYVEVLMPEIERGITCEACVLRALANKRNSSTRSSHAASDRTHSRRSAIPPKVRMMTLVLAAIPRNPHTTTPITTAATVVFNPLSARRRSSSPPRRLRIITISSSISISAAVVLANARPVTPSRLINDRLIDQIDGK